MSELHDNQSAPSILSWDVAHYAVNNVSEQNSISEATINRAIIGVLYLLQILIIGIYCLTFIWFDDECFNEEDARTTALTTVAQLVWVESASALMVGVGLKIGPLRMSLFHVFVRIVIMLCPLMDWFVGASLIYVIFCCRVGMYWASSVYPAKTVRQVLKEELRGALPEWMFSGGTAGNVDEGGANFVEQKALNQLAFSPLLNLAKYVDCMSSGDSSSSDGYCTKCCINFLQSSLFVLSYLTCGFVGFLVYVNSDYHCEGGDNDGEHCSMFDAFEKKIDANHIDGCLGGRCVPAYPNVTSVQRIDKVTYIKQWDVGILALCLVAVFVTSARVHAAWDYYGHTINSCPPKMVLIESFFMIGAWITTGFVFKDDYSLMFLALLFYVGPVFVVLTSWTLRNWGATEYVLCFKGKLGSATKALSKNIKLSKLKSLKISKDALKSNLSSLNPFQKYSCKKWWSEFLEVIVDRSPTLIGMLLGPVGCSIAIGILLQYFTDDSIFPYWLSWSIPAFFVICKRKKNGKIKNSQEVSVF